MDEARETLLRLSTESIMGLEPFIIGCREPRDS